MSRFDYKRKLPGESEYEGVRLGYIEDLIKADEWSEAKIDQIISNMEQRKLLVFEYDGRDRVVAPFVIGVSAEGNPLMRGFQLDGTSRSGKGPGWRVFQVNKMENLKDHDEFFDETVYDYKRFYPWIYKVFAIL